MKYTKQPYEMKHQKETKVQYRKERFMAETGTDKSIHPDKKLAVLSCMDTRLTDHWLEGFKDTEESVLKTVETIRTHPLVPQDITVRGFIIDSETGALEEVK